MANEQNLRPFTSDQSRDEAAKNGRKGGIASGEARRAKKTLREIMELYGQMPAEELAGASNDEAVVVAQYKLAKSEKPGSTGAAAFIRDTKGEKPHDVLETPDIEMRPLVDLTKRAKNGAE